MMVMKKALHKEFRREILGSLQRFISILLISALGVAFFAGLRACKTDMLLSADAFYDDTNMMDIRVLSALGMTDEELLAIQQTEGVLAAEGAVNLDALVRNNGEDIAVRLHSGTNQVNTCLVLEGRMPQDVSECAADEFFLKRYGFQVGDVIALNSGTEEELTDALQVTNLTIVGAVSTGRYLSSARGSTSIGTGKIAGYLIVPPENFLADYYTEINVTLNGTKELSGYEEAYDTIVEEAKDKLEAVSGSYEADRLQNVQAEAYEKLAQARDEVALNEQKLLDGEQELKDAEAQIADGYQAITDGRAELAEKEEALPALFAEYDAQLERGKEEISQALAEWEKAAAPVIAAREEYNNYVEQLQAISQGPEDIKKILAVMGISLEDIEAAEAQIAAAREEIQNAEDELTEQEKQLEEKKVRAVNDIADAKEQLDESEKELVQKEKELADAKQEYYAGLEENRQSIADAYAELEEQRAEIAGMETPEWYILDRNTIESYVGFEQDAERMDAISRVFPAIFFLVAALVSLTTMTRMVDEERTQIGTMKALGYSLPSIAGKYIKYALYATLIGSLIGVFAGSKIFPYIVITTYKLVYSSLPGVVMPIHVFYSVMATVLAVCCTLLATLAACMKAFREQPASLMRPVAPKAGKRILLEHIGILWKHLSFTRKASLRNMFRYKKRFFMTVIGIGGCMALLLVGFGLKDSIGVMSHIQYGELWLYDGSVSFASSASEEEKAEFLAKLDGESGVANAALVRESSVNIMAESVTKEVNLVVLPDKEAFGKYFVFRDRESGKKFEINDDEIIMTEKLARILGTGTGDTVYLQTDTASYSPVRISAVAENYIYHYIFMTASLYEKVFGEKPVYNECFLLFSQSSEEYEKTVASRLLKDYDIVTAVSVTSTFQGRIDDMLQSLNVITYVLIICAGMLAFIVLYNLSNINITERKRELATLKVLGFYDREVSNYLYRENVLLTLLGILLGIGLGKVLHGFVITTCEVDMVMFGHIIEPVSYLYSSLLTVLFSLLIGFMMHFRLKKIDMIESLKSIE